MKKKTFLNRLRSIGVMLLDVFLVNAAMMLACQLYYDMHAPAEQLLHVRNTAPMLSLLCFAAFHLFGLYKVIWRYASIDSLVQIILSSLVGAFSTYLISFVLYDPNNNYFLMPRPVYLFCWLLILCLVGGSRFLRRILYQVRHGNVLIPKHSGKRVMVVGAGWAGSTVIRDIQAGRYGDCHVVIAVDDDEQKRGTRILSVPVVYGTANVKELAKEYRIDDIVIAIATPKGDMKPLIEACADTGCRLRTITTLTDVKTGQTAVSRVRDVNIGDLLGREEKHLNMAAVSTLFKGKVVLITGGGGSIGSELCRQIMSYGPKKIVLYDISENYMYDLFFELKGIYGEVVQNTLELCVGSITDPQRLEEVFGLFSPEIVIHAAAHKHVPLMEGCPHQAVKNNVFGTYKTAQCAINHGVERFVMISTDKAVNPTNVMGATKRMAEILIKALQDKGCGTQFTAVRFGNVLGSHGSVVPIFEKQIRTGGPVTLTHPDIIRYFMTIPEAASLVLQAAAIATGGELFVLDMGKPVRIKDLAERMIMLYGNPEEPPVQIVYTGLRPGEKLYEELILDAEGVTRTGVDKVMVTKPEHFEWSEIEEKLKVLEDCLESKGDMVDALHDVIPTFYEPEEVNAKAAPKQATLMA